MSARLRFQLLGLLMVIVVLGFFTFTVLMYRKAFTPAVMVTAMVDKVGSQLQDGATVKARGVEVGEVSSITANGTGAKLGLRLKPEFAEDIPRTATAAMLPKTLFGDRYVSLNVPHGDERPLRDGDTIGQDHSASTIAIQDVLDDLVPVLKAVPPEKVAGTLSAVSTALQGKGEQLGMTLTKLGDYLGKMNPQLPALAKDMRRFADVTPNFVDAVPRLVDAMSNFSTTARTLTEQQQNLQRLYGSVTATSTDLNAFLRVNQKNLISLTGTTKPVLDLLERYSPEFPCMFRQIANQVDVENRVFGKGSDRPKQAHLNISVTASRGPYKPGVDDPKNLDDRGPRCYPVVKGGWWPQNPEGKPLQDGSTSPPPPDPPKANIATGDPKRDTAGQTTTGDTTPQSAGAAAQSTANSKSEQRVVKALVATGTGTPEREVPDWSSMLVGPLYRGSEVNLR